jgi:hypothetical protein
MIKELIQIKATLVSMNRVSNWVKDYEFDQEKRQSRSSILNWVKFSAIEREKVLAMVQRHLNTIYWWGGLLTYWSMCWIGVKQVAAQSKGVTETVIAVRQQTQPNLSHPSKWNGGLGSTQADNPTQRQSTNHSQANWPIEGYINQESATVKERVTERL